MTTIKFGTDGWRAIIAEDYTFSNVRLVSQAVAAYLESIGAGSGPLVVGYDTRFGSEDFAAAVVEVLAGNGVRTLLTDGPAPTPAVSLAVIERKQQGGVVITASHNPGRYNGFKYKPDYGGSASPEIIAQIESNLAGLSADDVKSTPLASAQEQGLVSVEDINQAYCAQLARLVDLEQLKSRASTVVYDAMYGAGAGLLPRLLEGGKLGVMSINQERNPVFPGIHAPEPIGINLEKLQRTVAESDAALGIATDGDADRVGIVDETGEFVNQLQVYSLLALYLLEVKGQRGPLVKTLSQSYMVDKLGELFGVPVYETAVGFKYVGPKMTEVDAILGGEESGGFGFRGHIPERDGSLAGLYILDLAVQMERPLSKVLEYLEEKVGRYYYQRVDLPFEESRRQEIRRRLQDNPPDSILGKRLAKFQTEDGFKYVLEDGTWLLIRFSGTEPVLRVYTETDSEDNVQPMLQEGRALAQV
ncbi:MAG: phosphoglucomutase/phosphomannomutase family protein [Chloroflexota bacterium]|nr:phosphoglucomutase/phosphomannomutase family protein [Chloroflexota bacterium]